MAYRKKTLRTMLPFTRKVARLTGEVTSIERRLKNLIPELQRLELTARAMEESIKHEEAEPIDFTRDYSLTRPEY